MSKVFSSCTVDVLHIFGKALCFFQNIGAVEAYNFSHTSVNFNPDFDKYLQGFISVLEELKLILDRLYAERNKSFSKSREYTLSTEITNASNYSVNLQNTANSQNYTNLPTNTTSQTYSELRTSSVTQNYLKLENSSVSHNFAELHNRNNGSTKSFSELPDSSGVDKFTKLQNTSVTQDYTTFKNTSTVRSFTDYKNETSVQNFTKIQNQPNLQDYTKLQTGAVAQSFNGFKNNGIEDNFGELQRDASTIRQNFNELAVPDVLSSSQSFTDLQSSSNLLRSDTITCSKSTNNDLLVTNTSLMASDNEIQISTNHLITNHNDLNAITFTNSLISDNPSLVSNSNYKINPADKLTDDQYIDHPSSGLTPGSQLISSAIESLVQESSNHEDEDDPLNSEEITFRALDVVNQDNINERSCKSNNINNSLWNEQQQKNSNNTSVKENLLGATKRKSCDKKSYTCNVCNKSLSCKSSLAHHALTHTGDKPFCCEHCGKLFTMSSNLSAHLTRQHNLNTESANSCPECGKLFVRKSALEIHLAGHRGDKRFACHMCGKKFTQKVTRDTHILTHTRTYPFSCSVCGRRFTSKSKLNFHAKKHGELQYSCSLCEKQFSNRQYLNAHYKTHNIAHAEAAPCCLDTVSESSRTQVIEVSHVTCSQCDLTFKTQRALTQHTNRKHNPLAPWYHCSVPDCNRPVKSFATRSQLHKHNKRHHSGLERTKYTCATCGKEYAEKYNLLHHERQNHTAGLTPQQLRPYACHMCPKRFTLKSKLNIHIRLHTQTAQFTCDICAKVFNRKASLEKHRSTQHVSLAADQTRVVPDVMNNITCNRCGKLFKSKNSLMYHLRLHDGNFQYACATCGKKFVRKCHYDEHVRTIHTTERPFKCTTCGRCFKNKKYWREHVRRVHTSKVTIQSLFDSIKSEDALTTQHNFHFMHHVTHTQPPPQPQTQPSNCLADVDVATSFVLSSDTFDQFQGSSSVQ